LEDAACLALGKSLNYAVYLAKLSIEDILGGLEMVIGALPEEDAEEVQQKTVRIFIGSCNPKDNLMGQERKSLRTLKAVCVLHDTSQFLFLLDTPCVLSLNSEGNAVTTLINASVNTR
jgi:hypothetical protein